jgi:fatty-acyl-CoA synthase
MRLHDYLDKGASLGADRPCLTTDGTTRSYADVVALSHEVAAALRGSGVREGARVAILSANDPVAFTCVFGISRAGAVWCPINPRNEAAENRELLDLFDAEVVLHQSGFAALVAEIRDELPRIHTWVRLDGDGTDADGGSLSWRAFLDRGAGVEVPDRLAPPAPEELAMLVGTGGTTGRPKGVMLTPTNLETMTALTLVGYPFDGPPVYLALAPLTHAAGVLCFPVMSLGGEVVIMRAPDVGGFLRLVQDHRVTHTFLPPTLIYMVLGHPDLASTDLSSLQCFWYGAAPMSASRLEEALARIGPVMAQLFGQTEAPMMISMMPPRDHFRADGSVATERLTSAGRPAPLVRVAILDEHDHPVAPGERGEICARSSLVMAGYWKDPEETARTLRNGWLHTGDIGFLDEEGFLHIVDRAKDMIITGGFNVYSTEVEQAVLVHEAVRDCAVVGLPDEKWGERVAVVVQPHPGATVDPDALRSFVKQRIGSVKAPKDVHVWPDLPRSKVGKVLKAEIKSRIADEAPG